MNFLKAIKYLGKQIFLYFLVAIADLTHPMMLMLYHDTDVQTSTCIDSVEKSPELYTGRERNSLDGAGDVSLRCK